jgi:hypothetical protein
MAEQEQRRGNHHEQQVLNHMHLQKEIAEGVERRRNCDEQCEQSPEERGQEPTIESVGSETAQLGPAPEVNESGQYQRQGWFETNRPGTEDGIRNIWHGLSNNSEKYRITLIRIARKSSEICEHADTRESLKGRVLIHLF